MPNLKKIHLATLGCARNQVDSEVMMGRLVRAGWTLVDQPGQAHVIVVNTCSFIETASDESIDTILTLAEFKRKGACRRLIVAGCLPERYRETTKDALVEVDLFLGTGAYDRIVPAVEGKIAGVTCLLPDPDSIDISNQEEKRLTGRIPSVYLKIAEGCNRNCTYCIIPKLRGRQKSRPKTEIVREAQTLIAAGARELVLVAQEATHYGADLLQGAGLADLLQSLARLSSRTWIRVLYGHPQSIGMDVIETIAETPGLLPYFDLPIQHASDKILKKMGRGYGRNDLLELFERIRHRIPQAILRTTVLTGFPGESAHDFKQLIDLVQRVRFDHLGVFIYSDADDLVAHHLPDPVPDHVAKQRYDRLMSLQMDISREKNQRCLGRKMNVLVEEKLESDLWMGRTAGQAPEVDGVTYIQGNNGPKPVVGQFIRIKVIDAMEYDLVGEVSNQQNPGESEDEPTYDAAQ